MKSPPTSDSLRLPADRVARVLHEVGEIYAAVDAPDPEIRMMAAVARVVDCYSAVLNALTLRPNRIASWSSRGAIQRAADTGPVMQRHLHEHPTLPRLVAAPTHGALRLSDVAGARELGRNPLVAGYYRPNGLRSQITFAVGRAETEFTGGVWVVGINRFEDREFSDDDVACGDALRPHVERAVGQLLARRRREAALVARDGAVEAAGCGLVALDAAGTIVDATPAARRILARWFGFAGRDARLPAALLARLAEKSLAAPARTGATNGAAAADVRWTQSDPTGARLAVHCRWPAGAAGLAGLWLKETNPADEAAIARALGLTARQATIARWVSEGKTNPEIAVLLGISPRTVDKHLEQMLARLGVENRAAIVRTVRDLGD